MRAIRTYPGNGLRLLAVIAMFTSLWIAKGATSAVILLGAVLLIGYPLAFLWWQRWGP